mgnify:CR=1 FL=1
MTDLQLIYDFVEQSNSTNSNTDKLNVLKTYTQYDSVKKALLRTVKRIQILWVIQILMEISSVY